MGPCGTASDLNRQYAYPFRLPDYLTSHMENHFDFRQIASRFPVLRLCYNAVPVALDVLCITRDESARDFRARFLYPDDLQKSTGLHSRENAGVGESEVGLAAESTGVTLHASPEMR
jgi:hypothetical protein